MAGKKEKKVKASLPPSSQKKQTPNGFTRTIPEPYLRGTVSIAKIDRAVIGAAKSDSHAAAGSSSSRAKFRPILDPDAPPSSFTIKEIKAAIENITRKMPHKK